MLALSDHGPLKRSALSKLNILQTPSYVMQFNTCRPKIMASSKRASNISSDLPPGSRPSCLSQYCDFVDRRVAACDSKYPQNLTNSQAIASRTEISRKTRRHTNVLSILPLSKGLSHTVFAVYVMKYHSGREFI